MLKKPSSCIVPGLRHIRRACLSQHSNYGFSNWYARDKILLFPHWDNGCLGHVNGCIVPDRTGLAPPPEEAKQHTNPSCHQERLEGLLVDLAFYGPVQILKALAPLLIDLGPRRLHGLLSLSSHLLHSLLDLSP